MKKNAKLQAKAKPHRGRLLVSHLASAALAVAVFFLLAWAFGQFSQEGVQNPATYFQGSGLATDFSANITLGLSNGPVPGDDSYFGFLAPYVLVDFRGEAGDLARMLLEVWVYPGDAEFDPTHPDAGNLTSGVDACGSAMHFTDFHVVAPVPAGNESTNVTYSSDTYTSPYVGSLPGGDKCAARFRLESNWTIVLRAEQDGDLQPNYQNHPGQPGACGPSAGVCSDSWDEERVFYHHGKAPLPGLPLAARTR